MRRRRLSIAPNSLRHARACAPTRRATGARRLGLGPSAGLRPTQLRPGCVHGVGRGPGPAPDAGSRFSTAAALGPSQGPGLQPTSCAGATAASAAGQSIAAIAPGASATSTRQASTFAAPTIAALGADDKNLGAGQDTGRTTNAAGLPTDHGPGAVGNVPGGCGSLRWRSLL